MHGSSQQTPLDFEVQIASGGIRQSFANLTAQSQIPISNKTEALLNQTLKKKKGTHTQRKHSSAKPCTPAWRLPSSQSREGYLRERHRKLIALYQKAGSDSCWEQPPSQQGKKKKEKGVFLLQLDTAMSNKLAAMLRSCSWKSQSYGNKGCRR